MSLDLARPFMFARALARVATNHEDIAVTKHSGWTSLTRILGEVVSLLALTYIAERSGETHPYRVLLGIFFAFFLPTIVLSEGALRSARKFLVGGVAARGVSVHILVGSVGVLLCYAVYEVLIKLTEHKYIVGNQQESADDDDEQ